MLDQTTLEKKRNQDIAEYYKELLALDVEKLKARLKQIVIGQDEFIDVFIPEYVSMISRMVLLATGTNEKDLPRIGAASILGETASGKSYFIKPRGFPR